MKSVFGDKDRLPNDIDLKEALADTFGLWQVIEKFTLLQYPNTKSGWHFAGIKYGWGYRVSDATRVLVYLLPRASYFKVGMDFGNKSLTAINDSEIATSIKQELNTAKAFTEGTGIRLSIVDDSLIQDIKHLIKIKIAH